MPLPIPHLDDRRFQDIVDEAKQLIPDYCPEWTNHNVADPGVALIELFAWMTELTLYRINQLPERMYRAFLDLVGVELLRPGVASTELAFWLSTASAPVVPVSQGTEVGTVRTHPAVPPVVFSTDEALRIIQPVINAFVVDGVNHWGRLREGDADVACFPSEPPQPGERFLIGFGNPLPNHIVRLDFTGPTRGVGVRPGDPPLRWEASTADGWERVRVWADTTGGLNRAGSVEVRVPRRHAVRAVEGRQAAWLRVSVARDKHPAYTGTPRISGLSAVTLGAVVRAHHGRVAPGEALGVSTGRPGQTFRLLHSPVLPRLAGEVVQVVTDDGAETWTEVSDFARSQPTDRHCHWDDACGEIRFGPALRDRSGVVRQYGAVPPEGARVVVTRYRSGGGSEGNVDEGALSVLQSTVPFIDRVHNRFRAHGGSDGETIEQAMARGPLELQHGERAVSADDFEWFAKRATAAVVRARALPPAVPGGPVRVLLVPALPHRPHDAVRYSDVSPLPPDVVEAVTQEIEPRRAMGTSVEIRPPAYVGVSVAAMIEPSGSANNTRVVQQALDLLYRYLHPLKGGATGTGWPFGVDVSAADLVSRLTAIRGLHHVVHLVVFAADLATGTRVGGPQQVLDVDEHSLPLSFRHSVVTS